ncbi:MAG: hypothetical protein FWG42_11115 [Clostridiales bacterium]|nr:hypothetical protein [Clostridiales bacterium]
MELLSRSGSIFSPFAHQVGGGEKISTPTLDRLTQYRRNGIFWNMIILKNCLATVRIRGKPHGKFRSIEKAPATHGAKPRRPSFFTGQQTARRLAGSGSVAPKNKIGLGRILGGAPTDCPAKGRPTLVLSAAAGLVKFCTAIIT